MSSKTKKHNTMPHHGISANMPLYCGTNLSPKSATALNISGCVMGSQEHKPIMSCALVTCVGIEFFVRDQGCIPKDRNLKKAQQGGCIVLRSCEGSFNAYSVGKKPSIDK
jgi:hypothetical protein